MLIEWSPYGCHQCLNQLNGSEMEEESSTRKSARLITPVCWEVAVSQSIL